VVVLDVAVEALGGGRCVEPGVGKLAFGTNICDGGGGVGEIERLVIVAECA
jgi:hypothetical protein